MAVRRARVASGSPTKGRADHAPDGVLAGEDLPGEAAGLVQVIERDRLLVRGDLEDGVGGRVGVRFPVALVLLAELFDDLGPGRGLVADHAAARPVRELLGSHPKEDRRNRSASPPA